MSNNVIQNCFTKVKVMEHDLEREVDDVEYRYDETGEDYKINVLFPQLVLLSTQKQMHWW